uniref:CW domain-containing protein n=1 Tax=Caenorhabditis tropicalis TaxID=1561998 RepID=A0A1I7TAI8_9PELO
MTFQGLARMNTFRASISFNGECQKFISNQTSTYPLWIQCFINCGKDNECQIAYISIDNTICFLCQTGVVKSLTRTKTGNIVALKNDDNEPPQCINGVYNLPVTTTVSSITAYTFADESLQSINAYKLLNTQADITALDCLQMLINSDATNGLVLNSRCDSITGYATYSRGAVCGVKPQ